jgi:hypothetical protein
MSMLGNINLSPESAELHARAESARLDFDFELARKLYLSLAGRMQKISWTNHRLRTLACAKFCHAFAVFKSTGSLEETEAILSGAAKDFLNCQDIANHMRANALRKSVEGGRQSRDLEFEEAADSFRAAAHQSRELKRTFEDEATHLEASACEFDLEACINDLTFLAVHRRYDDCKIAEATARRSFEVVKSLSDEPNAFAYLDGRFHFALAIVPVVKGQFALLEFRPVEAGASLREALVLLTEAQRLATSFGGSGPIYAHVAALYDGSVASCAAGIRHAELIAQVTSGQLFDAARLLKEVSDLYEKATDAHARCLGRGALGLNSSKDHRDSLRALAALIASQLDTGLLDAPQFASFIRRPDLATILQRDYRELLSCFLSGAYKMCVVCAGSMIEAMLVDLIQSSWSLVVAKCPEVTSPTPDAVPNWQLAEMIRRAGVAGIVSGGGAVVFDELREYRNLVHPRVELRGRHDSNRDAALAAIRALKWFTTHIRQP